MSRLVIILNFLVLVLKLSDSYKILGIFPSRNVHTPYQDLFRELANRNHQVTVITHKTLPNASKNYEEIILSEISNRSAISYEQVISSAITRVPFETLLSARDGHNDCETLVNNHHVVHMIRTRPHFDVIIAELYNSDCALALAANLTSTYIAFNPQTPQPWQYDRMGISFNPAYVPQSTLPYGKHPSFFGRLKSFFLYYITNWMYALCSQMTDSVLLYKYIGEDLRNLESVAANASLIFVNSHPSIFGGTPRAENVIDIGGIHLRTPKVLPTLIQRFINEAEHGVIFVNLEDSMFDPSLPREKFEALLATFKKLPFRVIFKWDGPQFENISNVLTMRWLPQFEILNQEKVLALICHASVASVIEAMASGVPVIAMPVIGSQFGQAAALQDAGIATVLNYDDLTSESLMDALNLILDPVVQKRAKYYASIWRDRPLSPLENAIYWVEYAARHNGAPHRKATSLELPSYQTYQWETMLVVFSIGFIVLRIQTALLSGNCMNRSDS